ncbi:MAG: ATP-binding protein [Pseudomonadota bacterium]
MSDPLSLERIRTLYQAWDLDALGWAEWLESYTAELEWAATTSDEELASEAGQEHLWKLFGITKAGPSENLNVDGVLQDRAFIDLVLQLRRKTWPPEPSRRAAELQAHYAAMGQRLKEVLSGHNPWARLVRIFAALVPRDLHCGLSWESHVKIRQLLVGRRRLDRVEAAAMARARLREALGHEPDLREHARRSMFCWWLFEHGAELTEGAPLIPGGGGDLPPPPTVEDQGGKAPTLVLWSGDRQHRWPQVFKGGVPMLRMPLRECLDGRGFEELREAIRDELGSKVSGARYLRRMLRELRRLGMLDEKDGQYVTTQTGEQLLESDPPDPLIEALICRISGFAHLLRELEPGPRARDELSTSIARFTAGDGGHKLWHRLAVWGQQTGLIERQGHRRALTALGREWAARLPAELPEPEWTVADDEHEEVEEDGAVEAAAEHPGFPEIWEAFLTDPELKGYLFGRDQVRALHAAWSFHERKRFAILSGLSGTGKTQLLRHYARLVCKHMGLDPKHHIAVVPVRPDWRDPTGLLGYFNALHAEPTFQVEPALRLVLRASRNPGLPFFLILDEMNLARVERYFAPFLSTMETGEDLQLHAEEEPVNEVPATIPWPANLRIGGTVNMDETTYAFSDKVLDRAFTMEFWQVNLLGFIEKRPGRTAADKPAEDALLAMQALLEPIRRHVGYRSAGEVLDWVARARQDDPEAQTSELLDQVLFSKVLPRLRGAESSALTDTLERLVKVCKEHALPRCADKLTVMRARLLDTGVTSFWS